MTQLLAAQDKSLKNIARARRQAISDLSQDKSFQTFQVARKKYEDLLKAAQGNLSFLIGAGGLANPRPLKELIATAEETAQSGNLNLAIKTLGTHEALYQTQKKLWELKKADKEAYEEILGKAQAECSFLIGHAQGNPGPLVDKIAGARGLAAKNEYAAARAHLAGYDKLAKELKKLSGEESSKQAQTNYEKAKKAANEQLTELEGYKELGDPGPAKEVLATAAVLESKKKFASALKVLEDGEAVIKAQLDSAKKKQDEKDAYLSALEKVDVGLKKVKDQKYLNIGLLNASRSQAIVLASGTGHKYVEARAILDELPAAMSREAGIARDNVAKEASYKSALLTAEQGVKDLAKDKPLADPLPVQQIIDAAKDLAARNQFAAALKRLNGYTTPLNEQKNRINAQKKHKQQYDPLLVEAEKKLQALAKLDLATPAPLAQKIATAKAMASGGNYDLAVQALTGYEEIAKTQTTLAGEEGKNKKPYEEENDKARKALEALDGLTDPLVDVADLRAYLQTAQGFAAAGKYSSAKAALKGWDAIHTRLSQWHKDNHGPYVAYQGAINEAKGYLEQLARLDPPPNPKLLQDAVTQAETLFRSGQYVQAAEALKNRQSNFRFLSNQSSTVGARKDEYTSALKAAEEALAELKAKGPVANPTALQQMLDSARAHGDRGAYDLALNALFPAPGAAKLLMEEAELNEAQRVNYERLLVAAQGNLSFLIGMGALCTPDPLQQLIDMAQTLAAKNQFAKAVAALDPHKEIYDKQKALVGLEQDPKTKIAYDKELLAVREKYKKLQTLANADAAPLGARIKEAEDLAKSGKMQSALDVMKTCMPLYKELKHQAVEKGNHLKANGTYEPQYLEKRKKLEDNRAKLLLLPGTEPLCDELREKLARAESFAKAKDFQKAYLALDFTMKKSTNAVNAGDKTLNNVKDKPFQDARQKAETVLKGFREKGPAKDADEFQTQLVAAYNLALDPKKPNPAQATEQLKNLTEKISLSLGTIETAAEQCRTLTDDIRPALQNLWTIAFPGDVQPLQARFDKALVFVGDRRYTEAAKKLQAIHEQTTARTARNQALIDEWKKAEAGELKDATTRMSKLNKLPGLGGALTDLSEQIRFIREELIGQQRRYQSAIKEVSLLATAVKGLEERQKTLQDLGPERQKAEQTVTNAELETSAALFRLDKAMQKGDRSGKRRTHGALHAERDKALATWKAEAANALTPEALTEAAAATVETLKDIGKRADELNAKPEAVRQAVQTEIALEDQKAYDKLLAQVTAELAPLQNRGGQQVDALTGELKKIQAGAPGKYKEAGEKLTALQKKVPEVAKALDEERLGAVLAAKDRSARAQKELEALKKGVPSDFTEYFDEVKKEIDSLQGMRESGNLAVIDQANDDLDELMARARLVVAQSKDKDTSTKSFKAVLQERKKITKKLTNKVLTKVAPTALAELQKSFKEVEAKTRTEIPAEALQSLAKFEKELDDAIKAAGEAKGMRDKVKKDAAEMAKQIDSLSQSAPSYHAKLKDRLKQIKTDAKTEKREPIAVVALESLGKELATATDKTTGPSHVITKEKAANEEKAKLEVERKEWESLLKIFDEKVAKTYSTLQSDPNVAKKGVRRRPDAYNDLLGLRSQAEETAKASDYAGARRQLSAATKVAERLQNDPQGLEATGRGKLKVVNERWRRAVETFKQDIAAMRTRVAEAAQTEPDNQDLPLIIQHLDSVGNEVFDAEIFSNHVKLLLNKKVQLPVRRKTRELALKEVRKYRARITKDPFLKVLYLRNPFGQVQINRLAAVLDDLDLNLQRSI